MSTIVRSKVKEIISESSFQMATDFVDALDAQTKEVIKKAQARAESNGRKTVMAKDL